jgi:diaminopimelate epimerase
VIPFTKMHGLGNDFVVLDAFRDPLLARRDDLTRLAIAMGDRRTGIGADGLILLALDSADSDCDMRIWNADGSDGVICGNGLRCAARLLVERGHLPGPAMRIRTGAGVRVATVWAPGGRFEAAEIAMGTPTLALDRLPVRAESIDLVDRVGKAGTPVCRVLGRVGVFVGVGNPHFVVPEADLDGVDLGREGPALERHDAFPERMNIQFVRVDARDRLTVRTWERGAGATAACGTGACAALVAMAALGRADSRATVALPGGELRIRWDDPAGEVHQAGPAAYTFAGRWPEGGEPL